MELARTEMQLARRSSSCNQPSLSLKVLLLGSRCLSSIKSICGNSVCHDNVKRQLYRRISFTTSVSFCTQHLFTCMQILIGMMAFTNVTTAAKQVYPCGTQVDQLL